MSFLSRLFHSFPSRLLLASATVACFAFESSSRAATFLFDATHAETAGNADWVIDEDSSPQRFPTPDQSTVTASTPETYWRGAISAWGIALVKLGHHVETLPSGVAITYLNSSNVQDLSHYQVFVVDEPNTLFTAAEKSAIVNWVNAGGSLFIVADHAGSDRNGDGYDSVMIWNDLFSNNGVQAAPFGIVFNSDNISPTTETADTSTSDPITHGPAGTITQFVYHNGASLTIDPTRNASVRGAVWTTSSHTNSNVMVAYGTFGAGKFVATGDSSPIDDGTGAPGNTLFNGWSGDSINDGQLVMNASIWLAATPGQAPAITNGPPPTTVIVGTPYSFSFTATGTPAPTYSVSGTLPPGLTLSSAGVLSGTATSAGTGSFPGIMVTASNGVLPNATQTFTLSTVTRANNYIASFGLTGTDAVLTADPDHDGLNNLLEYGLGLNPTVNSLSGLPTVTLKDYSGTVFLSMLFHRSSLATDLTYIVQGSSDLANWSNLGTSTAGGTTSGPGFVTETGSAPNFTVEVRDTAPFDPLSTNKRFMRLMVTLP